MARGFNAARGFVDGATKTVRRVTPCRICFNAARGFVGGATAENASDRHDLLGFNAARGFVGGAARTWTALSTFFGVSMPHAALWVVQLRIRMRTKEREIWFQCRTRLCGWCSLEKVDIDIEGSASFNAARGFVGGAADNIFSEGLRDYEEFQCRTRLCGWCSFVARSPCPPKGKKPFWKVSGNLRCLTENM